MSIAEIELPPKLVPVFTGEARYRGAYGGRGSGKTRSFAKMSAVIGYKLGASGQEGQILCGREFMNSLDESSLEEVKAAIRSEPFLAAYYEIGEKYIRSRDGRIKYTFAGLRHNIDSIKSKARVLLCWVDEAEPVSEEAWQKLIPTIREEGSEIWVTWNPERKQSPTHKRFRDTPPGESKIIELNWRDNPWFPAVLDRERAEDQLRRPDHYAHIWEGDFVTVNEGAYYAADLVKARAEGRIGKVSPDPLMTTRAVWDIGGTGAKADACAIWIVQYVGREIRWLDYYEAQGQPLAAHVNWLRSKGYDKALCVLPHDGATNDRVHDVSYESALRAAGFPVRVVANQGTGAATKRVEAARRLFPSMWFNEATCGPGLDAIGWYHEKRDPERGIGLGPNHDWSSHACLEGSALIATARGAIPISDVVAGDLVETPSGLARVDKAGLVRTAQETVEVTLSDGRALRMTPEHKVFTTRGVVTADALWYDDAVITARDTSCLKLDRARHTGYRAAFIESFGATVTGSGRNAATTSAKRAAGRGFFIERLSAAVRGRLSLSMAIGTILPLTIGGSDQRTLAAILHQNTTARSSLAFATICSHGMATTHVGIRASNTCIGRFGRTTTALFLSGITFTTSMVTRATTALRIFGSFQPLTTQGTMPRRVHGSEAPETNSNWSRLASWPRLGGKHIAASATNAVRRSKASPRIANSAARVVGIRRSIAAIPVYDLTVRHHHCYFANGLLVSNSDAFGLGAAAYEAPQSIPEPKFIPRKVL